MEVDHNETGAVMKAAVALLLLLPSAAVAALPSEIRESDEKSVATAQSVPCLRVKRKEAYVVRWVIIDKKTGEKRNPGSQEVRQRC